MLQKQDGIAGLSVQHEIDATISAEKRARMHEVVRLRTRKLVIVAEEVFYAHNASAIIRTAECFGIQDVHVIESQNTFKMYDGISRGAYKWMTVYRYRSTQECYEYLKKEGYRIIATTPHAAAKLPSEISVDTKTAVVFGNESWGLSSYALEHADGYIALPMLGFTESLNVSVCLSLCVYELALALRTKTVDWQLSQTEQQDLLTLWVNQEIVDRRK